MTPLKIISLSALTLLIAACQPRETTEEFVEVVDGVEVKVTRTTTRGIKMAKPDKGVMSIPDVTATWMDGCDEAFKDEISVTSNATTVYIIKDGQKVPLSSLEEGISIPWLTIYNAQQEPVSHRTGYNDKSVKMWNAYRDPANVEPGPWPSLETVATYSDLDISAIPPADLTFVKYSADWCVPCKAQSADLKTFKLQNPDLDIAHVEIIADTKKLGGKCPVEL